MYRIHSFLLVMATFLSLSLAAPAQIRTEDEAEIRAIVQSEADAWNRGDAEAFGAYYAENGSFTNVIGQQLYGRKAFIAQHASIFSTIYKGSHNTFSVSKITFLRPDVALVEIDGALSGANRLPPGLKAGEDGALRVKLVEVMSKEQGNWVIQLFHNVGVYPLPPGGPPK
jgi:uncharacterized protein (TIGR02246 family)